MSTVLQQGGTGNITGTESTVFDPTIDLVPGAGSFSVLVYTIRNNDAVASVLVRNANMHGAANWFPIAPGERQDFFMGGQRTNLLYAKSSTGTVSISGGVTGLA